MIEWDRFETDEEFWAAYGRIRSLKLPPTEYPSFGSATHMYPTQRHSTCVPTQIINSETREVKDYWFCGDECPGA